MMISPLGLRNVKYDSNVLMHLLLPLLIILIVINNHFFASAAIHNATKGSINFMETYEIINGNLYKVEDPSNHATRSYPSTRSSISNAVASASLADRRQKQIWEKINTFNDFKTNSIYNEEG